jgi:DNA-binding transcriptional ArsR family regulator
MGYKALGDETRLKMFRVLEKGEQCVWNLMDIRDFDNE